MHPLSRPVSLAAALLLSTPALAQSDTAAVRRELHEMKQKYDASLDKMRREYEARLQSLEGRLKATEAKTTATQATSPRPPASSSSSASAFNPAIGVVLDGKYAAYKKDPGNYRMPGFALGAEAGLPDRGFAIGESEVNFSASVDQVLYGNVTIAVEGNGEVSVEEAYLQSTGLPWGFTVKGGRFFSGIGYMNEQHAHVWDFADTALPYRAFLGGQLGDDGVQLRWLAPTDFFLEFGGEALRGDSFPAGGADNRGAGQFSGFAHAGTDIGESHSVRGGLSYLRSLAHDRATGPDIYSGRADTGIVDLVYKWAPGGNPVNTNLKLQGEYFYRRENGEFNTLAYSGTQTGWYAQAVYQFMPQWRVGLRHDQVEASAVDVALAGSVLDNMDASPKRNSVILEYNTSEFGRFRLQYNRDQSRTEPDDQYLLQYTITLGAHGAHAY